MKWTSQKKFLLFGMIFFFFFVLSPLKILVPPLVLCNQIDGVRQDRGAVERHRNTFEQEIA
jgi:hypothetical protein